jgi:O-methyltransferase involved in polyketide biosynthesis
VSLDLNHRERMHYAALFAHVADLAINIVETLSKNKPDAELFADYTMFALHMMRTREFGDIILDIVETLSKNKPDAELFADYTMFASHMMRTREFGDIILDYVQAGVREEKENDGSKEKSA